MKPGYQPSSTLIILAATLACFIANLILPPTSAQGPPVQVTLAEPSTAEQGTINLNVRVTGKGFKNGAQAKWFVTGTTNPGGVTVNSTTFVSSTELTANITVIDTAIIGNFDIQVLNSDGRGGKGTELFAVTPKHNDTTCVRVGIETTPCITGSGCLDLSFNGTGQVLTNTDGDIPSRNDIDDAHAVMSQSDGKLVVVGQTTEPSSSPDATWRLLIRVARYNHDGTLDTTFGDLEATGLHSGMTKVSLPESVNMSYEGGTIYTDSAGNTKILATARTLGSNTSVGKMFIARFDSDGSLDTTFGDLDQISSLRTGIKLVQIGTDATGAGTISATVVNGTTMIYLGGYANSQGTVFKLRDNGDLDTTFNGVGYVGVNHDVRSIAIQPDGKILAGGTLTQNPKQWDFAITRLTPLGQTDSSFGTNGQVTTDFFGCRDGLYKIKLEPTGTIIAAGFTFRTRKEELAELGLVRYTPSGKLVVKNSISGVFGSSVTGLARQDDGRIIVLTNVYVGCSSTYTLTRLNPLDLNPDTTFGDNGTLQTTFLESGGVSAIAQAITIQLDPACACHKIVAAGSAEANGGYNIALVRFVL